MADAVRQAETDTLAARVQADADLTQADRVRDEALANVASLESELAALLHNTKAELKESREESHKLQALARHDGKVTK